MALQEGLIKLKGKLDNLSFTTAKGRKGKNIRIAKMKGGVDGARIATDPRYSRTRENNAEFGSAGSLSALVYNESVNVTVAARDSQANSRLLRAIKANQNSDIINVRGERQVQWADGGGIEGFQFNLKRQFSATYGGKATVASTADDVTVEIASIMPMYDVKNQATATHYKLEFCTISLMADGTVVTSTQATDFVEAASETATTAETLTFAGAVTGATAVVVVASVKLYQELNGVKSLFYNQGYNASAILKVIAA